MTADSHKSIVSRIVRASFAVAAAHFSFKLVGLIQFVIAGQYFNDALFDVVYVFAFEGVLLSIFLIGEEVIIPSFLPVFMEQKKLRGESAAWQLVNVFLTVQTILLLLVILVIMCFPDQVIELLTYWDTDTDPGKVEIARQSVVWLAPGILCLSLGSTTYMLLNGYKRFFLAAFGDASWKICILVSLVIGIGIFHLDYRALVFGLSAGSVAKLLTHLIGLIDKLRHLRPNLNLRHPALKTILILMLPLIAGILFAKFRDIYNHVTILSYLKTDGLMKANSAGRKLYLAISWLVPYAVSIALFPFFCELVDKNDRRRLGEIMTNAGRMLLALFIPGAILVAVLSEPLAMVLFRGGEFTQQTTQWAALSNTCYILVLPAFALEYILMQGFFANRKMVSVTVIGMIFSAVSIAISYVCIRHLGIRGPGALMAVALGYVIARTLKTVTLIGVLKRTVPMFSPAATLWFVFKMLVIGLIVGAAGYLGTAVFEAHISAANSKPVQFIKLCSCGAVGVVVYIVGIVVLRVREPWTMCEWALQKVRRRRAEGAM